MEDPRLRFDIEEGLVQADQQGESLKTNKKTAWFDHTGKVCGAIFATAAALVPQIVYSESFHYPCMFWMASLTLTAGILLVFSYGISSRKGISHFQKFAFSFLNLLIGTAATSFDLSILLVVDKSYWYFASIPVLQIILPLWLSCHDVKSDQIEGSLSTDSEEHETTIQNCFKFAAAITFACYAMQAALLFGHYHGNTVDSKGCVQNMLAATCVQNMLAAAFLASAMGWSTMNIMSSPLPFKGDVVQFFLGKVPTTFMSVFVWGAAASLSTQFLNVAAIAFAGIIVPATVEIIVNAISKNRGQAPLTDGTSASPESIEVDSSSGAVLLFSIGFITMIYMKGAELHAQFLTKSSVFIYLSSIACSLIRMFFPFYPDCKLAKSFICSAVATGLPLLGFALFLIDIGTNGLSTQPASAPSPTSC